MTKIIVAQDAPVLVAIDIAKARHEVLIAIADKKRRRRLTVLNKRADFNRLVTALKEYGRPIRVGFEATGTEQYDHDLLVCGTNDIQELSKTHDIVSKTKTELWHRVLTHYLPLDVPEADRFHR